MTYFPDPAAPHVTIVGTVTTEPTLVPTDGDVEAYSTFRVNLASPVAIPDWYTVLAVARGPLAYICKQDIRKGDHVLIHGALFPFGDTGTTQVHVTSIGHDLRFARVVIEPEAATL